MKKVTYYIGAGASAQCLPVVNKMAKAITEVVQAFQNLFTQFGDKTEANINIRKSIEKDLTWLSKICEQHYSVDTYAKKLFLSGNKTEYVRLKNTLSIYFTLQEKLKKPDKRYDNFWASILDSTTHLPDNVRIISWNYDSQLELSFKSFSNSSTLSNASLTLGMSSFHNDHRDIYPNKFGVFKLNGSAKIIQNRLSSLYLVDEIEDNNYSFLRTLFVSYERLKGIETKKEDFSNELSFAWEHDLDNEYYTKLKESIQTTNVLVVIGYSFPYFNRKIDKLIINKFMPNLQTVYFQAPDAENLKERFVSLNNVLADNKLILKKDENQFTFPNELDI